MFKPEFIGLRYTLRLKLSGRKLKSAGEQLARQSISKQQAMANAKRSQALKFVKHPRYGDKPLASGYSFSQQEIERAHWRYASLEFFIETAIPATISKQNYAVYPRKLYVDLALNCEQCQRPFIFYAKEQRYWFEDLGFWVDAHCTQCIECRRQQQQIKRWQRQYQGYMMQPPTQTAERRELKQVALELYQRGYLRDVTKVNAIKL